MQCALNAYIFTFDIFKYIFLFANIYQYITIYIYIYVCVCVCMCVCVGGWVNTFKIYIWNLRLLSLLEN